MKLVLFFFFYRGLEICTCTTLSMPVEEIVVGVYDTTGRVPQEAVQGIGHQMAPILKKSKPPKYNITRVEKLALHMNSGTTRIG